MKTFLICPVRGHEQSETEAIVKKLEDGGWQVHWPPRDTKQDGDPTGLRICRDNRKAMLNSVAVHIIWDGKSQGCLFDLGMAFALNMKVYILSLPPLTEGKSFQNMVTEWSELTLNQCHGLME